MSVIDQLKSSSLQKADGANASADCLNGKAVILIYFSAHWCPPCRAFTPMLKDFYEVRRLLQAIAMTTKTNKASIYISGGRRGRRWNYLCVQWQVTTRHGQLYEGKCTYDSTFWITMNNQRCPHEKGITWRLVGNAPWIWGWTGAEEKVRRNWHSLPGCVERSWWDSDY